EHVQILVQLLRDIRPGAAVEGIGLCVVAEERVVSVAAVERVVARAGDEVVFAGVAGEIVVAAAAFEGVVAAAAEEAVVPAAALEGAGDVGEDRIIPAAGVKVDALAHRMAVVVDDRDAVVTVAAGDGVGAVFGNEDDVLVGVNWGVGHDVVVAGARGDLAGRH